MPERHENLTFMKGITLLILLSLSSCSKEFVLNQNVAQKKWKLCFIGDTGTGSQIQKDVASKLASEKCDSIHFLGDLVYPSGIRTPEDPASKNKFLNIYQDFSQNLFLIMGNHDYRGSIDSWISIAETHPKIIFPNPFYLLKLNDLCLIHLDTNVTKLFEQAPVALKQTLWLESLGDELENCYKSFVLTHHPYNSRGKHHGPATGLLRLYLWADIIGSFDYLISGHDHILSNEGEVDGTRLLISGAGGSPEKDEAAGYLIFEVEFEAGKTKHLSHSFKTLSK